MRELTTYRSYCALRYGIRLRERSGGIEVGARDFPADRGGLRQKRSTAAQLLDHPDRLTAPLVGGQASTWDDT